MPVLQSIHLYPVKSIAGSGPGEAVVEPWGLAGDRRWLLVDAEGRQLTQRQQRTLALARAEELPGGGLGLTAPGREPLTVAVPASGETVPVEVWKDEVEAVPAGPEAAEWFRGYLGIESPAGVSRRPGEAAGRSTRRTPGPATRSVLPTASRCC